MLLFPLAREFAPGRWRRGPTLQIFAIDPENVAYRDEHRFAFDGGAFRYPRTGAFLLLKEYFSDGAYRFELDTVPVAVDGRIRATTRDGREADELAVEGSVAQGSLPWSAKYFFYVYLPAETEIRAMALRRVGGTAAGS
jgi:hypothetical protein